MTDLNPVTTTTATSAAATETNEESRTTLTTDYDMFLQMLTAQAEYQDPLDPISSSDYAAQLATFSMVEQQVFTNEQLTTLSEQLSADTFYQLANWVGMEVQATASAAFDGTPVTVVTDTAAGADAAQLVIFDDSGSERGRRNLVVADTAYEWDGTDQTGADLPTGNYTFKVESYENGELISSAQAPVYSKITEAQIENGATFLRLEGGGAVPAAEVTAVRRPSA